jgi:hypothetical protein
MSARQQLPDRRASATVALECADPNYVATVSRFGDGRGKPIFSSRIRFIATLGFPRRRRWRDPFTADLFRLERRLIGGAP